MRDATKEVVRLKKFIAHFGIIPIPLLCENNGTITQEKEAKSHKKSKHILRCFYLIREIVVRGDGVVERVLSTKNIIDPLTKPLAHKVF